MSAFNGAQSFSIDPRAQDISVAGRGEGSDGSGDLSPQWQTRGKRRRLQTPLAVTNIVTTLMTVSLAFQ